MVDSTSGLNQKNLFNAIVNTVSDGISVIDKDLKVLFQNKANASIYGDRAGQYCYKAYRASDEPCENCLILKVLEEGVPKRGIRDIHLPNGHVIWVEIHAGPFKDDNGKVIGAVEVVRNITEQIRLTENYVTLRREMESQFGFENIVTQSKKMKSVFKLIERVAATSSSVLISGESGTGKELVAKAIFLNSNRKDKPFVSINCGAIPENLLESELFGHKKGAFTGAVTDHKGLIETADGGTLFLDEIGELPLSLQVKLLRFLQEGEIRKVGDNKIQKHDVRIISATNKDLDEAVKAGEFREDLYFRTNVIPIHIPPLRERKEDIPMLATHLFQRMCDKHNRNATGISPKALKLLIDYNWPGNVRELENAIEYALHFANDKEMLKVEHIPIKIHGKDLKKTFFSEVLPIDEYCRQAIVSLQEDHNEQEIATILGISRKSLWEKRKRWELLRNPSP